MASAHSLSRPAPPAHGSFFSGPEGGGRVKGLATKKNFFDAKLEDGSKALVAGPLKKIPFLRLP